MSPLNLSSLPEEARAWLEERVASGLYSTPEEVLSAAMQALELVELREQVELGIRQLEAGECRTYDLDGLSELKERICQRGAARIAASKNR